MEHRVIRGEGESRYSGNKRQKQNNINIVKRERGGGEREIERGREKVGKGERGGRKETRETGSGKKERKKRERKGKMVKIN